MVSGVDGRRPAGVWIAEATFVSLALVLSAPAAAQFTEWDSFSITNGFTVTAVVRGLGPAPLSGVDPEVRFEAIVGYAGAGGNEWQHHSSGLIPAPDPEANGIRYVDTSSTVDFTNSGIVSAFDGLCCSNDGAGLDDDSSIHQLTDFAAGESFEFLITLPNGTVESLAADFHLPDPILKGKKSKRKAARKKAAKKKALPGPQGALGPPGPPERVYVGTEIPGPSLTVATVTGSVGTPEVDQVDLPDCLGADTNWHYDVSGFDGFEIYVTCVTTGGNFVIKRVSLDDFTVQEIVLAGGVPLNSALFTYVHTAACATPNGFVVGAVLPRLDLGTTTFHAVYLDAVGAVTGTSQLGLPGARSSHQAFFCRPGDNVIMFVSHGPGAIDGETDTFVIQTKDTFSAAIEGAGEPVIVHQVTEARTTVWADHFNNDIWTLDEDRVDVVYRGPEPIAELGTSEVRYGAIQVPLFVDGFEGGDADLWSTQTPFLEEE